MWFISLFLMSENNLNQYILYIIYVYVAVGLSKYFDLNN